MEAAEGAAVRTVIVKTDNKGVISMKKAKYVSPRVLGSAVVHPC